MHRAGSRIISVVDIMTGKVVIDEASMVESAKYINVSYGTFAGAVIHNSIVCKKYKIIVTGKVANTAIQSDFEKEETWAKWFSDEWDDNVMVAADLIRTGKGKMVNVISHGKRKKFTERIIL